jgi:hypothetical protein
MSSSKSKRLITDSDEEMNVSAVHLYETRSTNNSTASHAPNQSSNAIKSSSSGDSKETQKRPKIRKSITRSHKKNDDEDYEVSLSSLIFIFPFRFKIISQRFVYINVCVCVCAVLLTSNYMM